MYSDDGSVITRQGTVGTSSEYWTVTTTDGTVYTFGKGTAAVGGGATNSRWVAPVFGNNAGEPCFKTGDYAGSACLNTWRWNLDSVVDVHGNAINYTYAKEEGRYGQNLNKTIVAYDRGGYLTSIAYGLSTKSVTTPASGLVTFTPAERCFATGTGCTTGNLSATTAPNYPDVPFDQTCYAATGTVTTPSTGGCPRSPHRCSTPASAWPASPPP